MSYYTNKMIINEHLFEVHYDYFQVKGIHVIVIEKVKKHVSFIPAFIPVSKLTIETLEQGVKYVQS